jgi:hypothetical protein
VITGIKHTQKIGPEYVKPLVDAMNVGVMYIENEKKLRTKYFGTIKELML